MCVCACATRGAKGEKQCSPLKLDHSQTRRVAAGASSYEATVLVCIRAGAGSVSLFQKTHPDSPDLKPLSYFRRLI